MQQIDAIFEDGVFKPIGPVALVEKQRVRLNGAFFQIRLRRNSCVAVQSW